MRQTILASLGAAALGSVLVATSSPMATIAADASEKAKLKDAIEAGKVELFVAGSGVKIPGSAKEFPKPVFPLSGSGIAKVALSDRHAAAVDGRGDVWVWGEAYDPDFVKNSSDCIKPQRSLQGYGIKQVICTSDKLYALGKNGAVYALPADGSSLGHKAGWLWNSGAVKTLTTPGGFSWNEKIAQIAGGDHHLAAVTSSGRLLTSACHSDGNSFGQLGHSIVHPKRAPDATLDAPAVPPFDVDVLKPVEKLAGPKKVAQVACGRNHTLALTTDGKVYSFGDNTFLQLGHGDATAKYDKGKVLCQPVPTLVQTFSSSSAVPEDVVVTAVAAGGDVSGFVVDGASTSELFISGFGLNGALGNSTWNHVAGTPVKVNAISNKTFYDDQTKGTKPVRISSVSIGRNHVTAKTSTHNGSIDWWIWGHNAFGQFGNGKVANTPKPLLVCHDSPQGTGAADTEGYLRNSLPSTAFKGARVEVACGANQTAFFAKLL